MTNVLVVVADDMRYDHLPYMAGVRQHLQQRGVSFTAARCNVALCQPNRVGFFSGQLSKHHGETQVGMAGSEFRAHDDGLGAWLAEAGYRCGLFGKYINYYDDNVGSIPAPAGWATWREFGRERTQEEYDVRFDDELRAIAGRYQTDFLADEASSFVAGPEPWFAYVAPKHPHAPFGPHPDDQHAWSNARLQFPDAEDFASKPFWMHGQVPLTAAERAFLEQSFRGRLRELNAVDRMVVRILESVRASGALDRTVVVFVSDNGVHQGEQRRLGEGTKGGPYDVGLRVPLVVCGPGFEPGRSVSAPVYPAQDVTALLVDIASAQPRLPDQAGVSLREVAAEPRARRHRQRVLLHEIGQGFASTGDGVTTGPDHELGYLKYFRYPSVRSDPSGVRFREMYDLATDPDENVSLARDPASRELRQALEAKLDAALA